MDMVSNNMTDEELVARCATSERAMELLLSRYARHVRACTRSFFLSGLDREDLAQEGMIGLLSAVRHFDSTRSGSFRTYATTCIRNRLISFIRTESKKQTVPLDDTATPNSLTALLDEDRSQTADRDLEERIIREETLTELSERLNAVLSGMERRVLPYYLEGLSYRDIANQLNLSAKSVDNAVQRIRSKLARQNHLA